MFPPPLEGSTEVLTRPHPLGQGTTMHSFSLEFVLPLNKTSNAQQQKWSIAQLYIARIILPHTHAHYTNI